MFQIIVDFASHLKSRDFSTMTDEKPVEMEQVPLKTDTDAPAEEKKEQKETTTKRQEITPTTNLIKAFQIVVRLQEEARR